MVPCLAKTLELPLRPARSLEQVRLAEVIFARDGLMRDRTVLIPKHKPDDRHPQTSAQTAPQSDRSLYFAVAKIAELIMRVRAEVQISGRGVPCLLGRLRQVLQSSRRAGDLSQFLGLKPRNTFSEPAIAFVTSSS
jgi:hypothetical protein